MRLHAMVPPPVRWARAGKRRGLALVVVLALLSIALALSYAMMRSHATAIRIQHNSGLAIRAHHNALAGLAIALGKMHQPDWAGVGTTLAGNLGPHESYRVTYQTGDPSLAGTYPEASDFAYRVTLMVEGEATDPAHAGTVTQHRIQAVVRLVPQQLAPQPSDWPGMQQYLLYQVDQACRLDLPCRIEGRVRLQGQLGFALNYPDDAEARGRYLSDLNAMRLADGPDYRPLAYEVSLPFSRQDPAMLSDLTERLGVTATDIAVQLPASDWKQPQALSSYQIYPGGEVYSIPRLGDTLNQVSLGPDPHTNPLGIFYHGGSTLAIWDNVTFEGTVVSDGDIAIEGDAVRFEPVNLLPLASTTTPIRLPVLVGRRLMLRANAGNTFVTGFIALWDRLLVEEGTDLNEFHTTGRMVCSAFEFLPRLEWKATDWSDAYAQFLAQTAVPYFPQYMSDAGRNPAPRLRLTPDPDPITYHWPWMDSAAPLYQVYQAPDGLRWDLVSIQDER